jgi:hypothetical protein
LITYLRDTVQNPYLLHPHRVQGSNPQTCYALLPRETRIKKEVVSSSWIRLEFQTITQTKRGLNAATKWMIQESVLDQFSLAREEEEREGKERRV